jgi:ABC-type Fe3+-siderophore transport system permease subunit
VGEHFRPVTINFASVNITGVPGLSLVVIVVAIAFEFPEARWLLISGLAGGMVLGAAMILVRRRRSLAPQRHHWIDATRD